MIFPKEYTLQKSKVELPICEYISRYEYLDQFTLKENIY